MPGQLVAHPEDEPEVRAGAPLLFFSSPRESGPAQDIPPPPADDPPLSRDSLDAGPVNEAKCGEPEEEKYSHK